LKSKASVLIMIGPPGTGKTSLVRDFAYRNKLKTYLTFDESIIASDGFFVDFMTDKKARLLVMEDADVLISSREEERNEQMAKFLNVSDGLVSHEGKKMIFTTNLSDINKIDSALIRPGRCHGVLNFRLLKRDEINDIRSSIDKPNITEKGDSFPLTKAFNDINYSNVEKREKVQFGIV